MTTINEFLPFADQSTANLIPYAEWVNAAKRLTGFVSGIAKSNEMNRVFAQGAQAGYAIAKFIERTLSEDVYVADGERLADQFYRAIVQMSYRATPIGCILTFPVHVEIDGYVATNNGGNLSQTTYDQLYAVYGTKFNTSSTLANQFGIPDMAHRVFEAAATLEEIGCYVAAGLPNISVIQILRGTTILRLLPVVLLAPVLDGHSLLCENREQPEESLTSMLQDRTRFMGRQRQINPQQSDFYA